MPRHAYWNEAVPSTTQPPVSFRLYDGTTEAANQPASSGRRFRTALRPPYQRPQLLYSKQILESDEQHYFKKKRQIINIFAAVPQSVAVLFIRHHSFVDRKCDVLVFGVLSTLTFPFGAPRICQPTWRLHSYRLQHLKATFSPTTHLYADHSV